MTRISTEFYEDEFEAGEEAVFNRDQGHARSTILRHGKKRVKRSAHAVLDEIAAHNSPSEVGSETRTVPLGT